MPQFTFRLQPLLDQKLEAERAARLAIAQRLAALADEQDKLTLLEHKAASIQHQLTQARAGLIAQSGAVSSTTLHYRNNFIAGLDQDLRAAQDNVLIQRFAVEEAETALAQARAHALHCSREVEKLDKYREKLESRHRAAIAKKEELEQDEIGTVMFLSRKAGQ